MNGTRHEHNIWGVVESISHPRMTKPDMATFLATLWLHQLRRRYLRNLTEGTAAMSFLTGKGCPEESAPRTAHYP